MKYEIRTPHGDRYLINEVGQVLEYSNGFKSDGSDDWKIVGICELKPFGHIGRPIPLNRAVKIEKFTYKNGNPKYTAMDLDHGTCRIWGNTKYHGISSIQEVA